MKYYKKIIRPNNRISIINKPVVNRLLISKRKVSIYKRYKIKVFKDKIIKPIYKNYRLIPIYYPYYSDFVILDNLYIPVKGEYFLN